MRKAVWERTPRVWPYNHLIRSWQKPGVIVHVTGRMIPKAIQGSDHQNCSPITDPECLGPLGPMGAWCLLPRAPSHQGSCSLQSYATFLGQSSCGSDGSRCSISCAQQSYRGTAASINISKDKAFWQSPGLRTPTPGSCGPRQRTTTELPKVIGIGPPSKIGEAGLPSDWGREAGLPF